MIKAMKNTLPDATAASFYTRSSYYPWQESLWKKLYISNMHNGHFPHALLFNGIAGIGKKDLAFYLAKGLLCSAPQNEPCHQCRSCQIFSAGSHPDVYHLTIPEDKKIIPVDSVRDLIQWSVLNSQFNGKKVIIIEPAEAMNQSAANSLLKTLEEPVSDTIIILLTQKKQALLATIRSRCQTIDLVIPEMEIGLNWLQQQFSVQDQQQAKLLLSLANGAPLLALALKQSEQIEIRQLIIDQFLSININSIDAVKVADELSKKVMSQAKQAKAKKNVLFITAYDVIYWIDSIVIDLARLIQGTRQNNAENFINNSDYAQKLSELSYQLDFKKLLKLSDLINKAYYEIQGQININLLFELLFIDWKNCKI